MTISLAHNNNKSEEVGREIAGVADTTLLGSGDIGTDVNAVAVPVDNRGMSEESSTAVKCLLALTQNRIATIINKNILVIYKITPNSVVCEQILNSQSKSLITHLYDCIHRGMSGNTKSGNTVIVSANDDGSVRLWNISNKALLL